MMRTARAMAAATMAVRAVPLKKVPPVLFCTGTAVLGEVEATEEETEEAMELVLDGVVEVEETTEEEEEVEGAILERTPMAPD